MLFPLRLVDPDGPQQDNAQTQIKANSLMVTLRLVIVETVRRQFSFGRGRNRSAPLNSR